MMKRLRYPESFNTKRELLWYIKGLKDAKNQAITYIESEEQRYIGGMKWMDFDKKGNVLPSSAPPTMKLRGQVR